MGYIVGLTLVGQASASYLAMITLSCAKVEYTFVRKWLGGMSTYVWWNNGISL